MSKLPKGRILDIGAGESPWREWLPNGSNYFGIDVENSNDFGMRQKKDDVIFFDGSTIPYPDNSFVGAICIEVLEHAINPEMLISEAFRVLENGAPLLLTVPFSARRHHIPYDFHRFTRERLFQLLENASFENISIFERGNDIAAITSKIIVVAMRSYKSISYKNILLSVPTSLFFVILSLIFIPIAHLSMIFDGGKEDPLGYFCTAYKK